MVWRPGSGCSAARRVSLAVRCAYPSPDPRLLNPGSTWAHVERSCWKGWIRAQVSACPPCLGRRYAVRWRTPRRSGSEILSRLTMNLGPFFFFFFFFRQNQEIVGVPVANSGGVNHAVEPPSSEGKPPDSAGSARRSRLLDRSGTAQ